MSLVLSGCSRSGEILYFDREEAGNEYVRELGGDVELPSRKELPEEEPEFRQEALRQICVHVCGQVCRTGGIARTTTISTLITTCWWA